MKSQAEAILAGFPPVAASWFSGRAGGKFKDTVAYEALVTQAYQLIAHVHPSGHPNVQRAIYAINNSTLHGLEILEGILRGTVANLESGLISSIESRIAVEITGDFLDSARTLLNEGQKDPAAVLACIALEDTLKRLATRHGLSELRDKEMSVVAASLFAAKLLDKSALQSINSFKSLRNAALHAQWHEVSEASVAMLMAFLPPFVNRYAL